MNTVQVAVVIVVAVSNQTIQHQQTIMIICLECNNPHYKMLKTIKDQ